MTYRDAWPAAMRPWWHVVARSIDVAGDTPTAARLLGVDLAVWRDGAGAVHAVEDRCPHRGVALSLGAVSDDGCLVCPYHNWAFDGTGACRTIPQLAGRLLDGARAVAHRVHEAHGFVWVCLVGPGEERAGVPRNPELDAGTHWFWMGDVQRWDAQNLRQVENFCDVAHFAVLHVDSFGDAAARALAPDPVQVDDGQLRFRFETTVRDPSDTTADRPSFPGCFDYRVTLPCTVHLGGASGPGSVMFIHSTPVDVDRTTLHWGCAFPHGVEIDDESYMAIEDRIWSPDRRMVASQRPVGLPLEPTAELHLPHDRFAVAYRRALAGLGVPSSAAMEMPVDA